LPLYGLHNFKQWHGDKQFPKIVVLTDDNTSMYCLPILTSHTEFPFDEIRLLPGEKSKTIENAAFIWNQLLEMEADRNTLLVNLGGGMICDIGGFCAAAFKRGIRFINIPTTLLAMVDAAIGGKTGVNLGHFKNQVGLFIPADEVIIDPVFLDTLPKRELIAGYAEVLKCGLIYDIKLWDILKNKHPEDIKDWTAVIEKCTSIKQEVVKIDPKEKGLRKILNFGHTIGHAIESFSLENDDVPLLHGEAVAIGMIAEAWLSWKKAGLSKEALDEIISCISRIFPGYEVQKPAIDDLIHYIIKDKKNVSGEIRLVLLEKIGKAVYDIKCSLEEIEEALDYYYSLK
jgi:3-dehydroquinate synthase